MASNVSNVRSRVVQAHRIGGPGIVYGEGFILIQATSIPPDAQRAGGIYVYMYVYT